MVHHRQMAELIDNDGESVRIRNLRAVSVRLLFSDLVRLKLPPRGLLNHPIYKHTRSTGLLLNLAAQSSFGRFGRRLGVK
jgi:hypothetical protein